MTNILQVTFSDWEKIQYIQKNDGYPHPYYLTKERIKQLFEKGQQFYLIYEGTNPIGFYCIDYDIKGWIHFFSILQAYQQKGFGTLLMKSLIKDSQIRNMSFVYIYISQEATIMIKFLKKFHFTQAGFHKDRYGKGKDALIYNLLLS